MTGWARLWAWELSVGRDAVIWPKVSEVRNSKGSILPLRWDQRVCRASLASYWNERKAPETGVVPILSGYTLGFWRGREEGCQAQFL